MIVVVDNDYAAAADDEDDDYVTNYIPDSENMIMRVTYEYERCSQDGHP